MTKVLLLSVLAVGLCFGGDYSKMSTQDMMKMQGNVPPQERETFRLEMQKRVQNMTKEEQDAYFKERNRIREEKRVNQADKGIRNMNQGQGPGMGGGRN
ncbi:DUF1104 domain-containing protein [bacterium]|nr:DUF1104 domain-containing protein [bacterium]MBU1990950.1 DUF1104 domain-containing protein [bacterium]